VDAGWAFSARVVTPLVRTAIAADAAWVLEVLKISAKDIIRADSKKENKWPLRRHQIESGTDKHLKTPHYRRGCILFLAQRYAADWERQVKFSENSKRFKL